MPLWRRLGRGFWRWFTRWFWNELLDGGYGGGSRGCSGSGPGGSGNILKMVLVVRDRLGGWIRALGPRENERAWRGGSKGS